MTSEAVTTTALQRFGHVLGWTGTAGAALCAAGAIAFLVDGDSEPAGFMAICAVLAYVVGRGLRYIFAGK